MVNKKAKHRNVFFPGSDFFIKVPTHLGIIAVDGQLTSSVIIVDTTTKTPGPSSFGTHSLTLSSIQGIIVDADGFIRNEKKLIEQKHGLSIMEEGTCLILQQKIFWIFVQDGDEALLIGYLWHKDRMFSIVIRSMFRSDIYFCEYYSYVQTLKHL